MTSAPAGSSGSNRILLVSYHYGPDTETGGFRWTSMVPGLAERGWQFDILVLERAVDFGQLGVPDQRPSAPVEIFPVGIPSWAERLALLGTGTVDAIAAVLRTLPRSGAGPGGTDRATGAVDPNEVRIARRGAPAGLRATIAQGLAGASEATRQAGWARAATRIGLQLVRQRRHGAVVVSSPPHSTQQVGAEIARLTGIPYFADFRDPWYFGIGPSRENANPVLRWQGRRLEPTINRRARVVVHNTPEAMTAVAAELGMDSVERRAIPNGYDSKQAAQPPSRERFIIAFTGVLHPWMDVRVLLAACQRFQQRHPDRPGVLAIQFMGTEAQFGGVDLTRLAEAYGLGNSFELLPRSSRAEAFRLQESAAVLVAFDCTHTLCIPTKFYDYARLCGTMLLLGHPDGAMAAAARQIGVSVRASTDQAGIDQTLDEAFRRWDEGEMTSPTDRDGIFDRRRQTEAWDNLLRSVALPNTSGA